MNELNTDDITRIVILIIGLALIVAVLSWLRMTGQVNRNEVREITERREKYLVWFVMSIVAGIAIGITQHLVAYLAHLVIGIIFLIEFVGVAKRVMRYGYISLTFLSLAILFIPFLSILLIAAVDRKIYQALKAVDNA